jgi:hypothetical protein
MDLHAKPSDPLTFHRTGRIANPGQRDGLTPIDGLGLRPALLAHYRELDALRHDFPLVLVERAGGAFVQSLSSLVDAMLKDLAPRGIEGERLRRHALQLEREIRRAVDAGATGTLAELWAHAAAKLGAREGETLEQVLSAAGTALPMVTSSAAGPTCRPDCSGMPGRPRRAAGHASSISTSAAWC